MTDIEVDSPSEIAARLRALAQEYPRDAADATWLELAKVMNKSLKLCPIDTGNLRGSRSLPEPAVTDGLIEANIGYSAGYAWFVHEIMENYHKPPTQAKFLEQPLMEALPTLQRKIARRVVWLLKRGGNEWVKETVEKYIEPPKKR